MGQVRQSGKDRIPIRGFGALQMKVFNTLRSGDGRIIASFSRSTRTFRLNCFGSIGLPHLKVIRMMWYFLFFFVSGFEHLV